MNRFKREIRRKGVLLEDDYPFLPFTIDDMRIISISVDSEKANVHIEYASITEVVTLSRNGNLNYDWH